MKVYLNGKFIAREKAVVSIDDHGFLYGDGIYETLRVYDGKVFKAKEHLARLAHSARGVSLKLPLSMSGFVQAMDKVVRVNKLKDGVIRLTVTRGPGPYGFDPRPCKKPTVVIVPLAFSPYPLAFHQKGITVGVVSVRRNNPRSLPPHVKSTSCMNGVLAKMESIKLGAQEGVMLTTEGFLAEGTVSNIFVVKRGVVMTPALDGTLLAGVTREHVLALAKKFGFHTSETHLELTDLLHADEAFLSNTTMEVMPIREVVVGGTQKIRQSIGKGAPGPLTRQLMAGFRNAKLPAQF
jgi:branched-chain amino acid aminotransferase